MIKPEVQNHPEDLNANDKYDSDLSVIAPGYKVSNGSWGEQ